MTSELAGTGGDHVTPWPIPAPGHPSDRRQPEPGKITRKGGRRPSRVTRSALARDLARLHTGAPGGWPALAARAPGADRCGAEPVRRAAGTTRAPTPPWPGGPKSGRRRPGAQRSPERPAGDRRELRRARSAHPSRGACQDRRPAGARRAPRALETVEKVLTGRRMSGLSVSGVRCPVSGRASPRLDAVGMVNDVTSAFEAEDLAEPMLAASLPRRWRHVRSVARRARWVAKQLSLSDDLVAAAWLHDIGYAPELVVTGFHPLDGARYLRREGVDATGGEPGGLSLMRSDRS